MADVGLAIKKVLQEEDPKLLGKVTNIPGDAGGATRFGIASRSHPELVSKKFFDETVTDRITALNMAIFTYTKDYANHLWIADIKDQILANAVLSYGVNAGIGTCIGTLQWACRSLGNLINVDGDMGFTTCSAVNSLDSSKLFMVFCRLCLDHYRAIPDAHPQDEKFLNGWINRVVDWQKIS